MYTVEYRLVDPGGPSTPLQTRGEADVPAAGQTVTLGGVSYVVAQVAYAASRDPVTTLRAWVRLPR